MLLGLLGVASTLFIAAAIDYRSWVSFGTGGTPHNLQGYLKITKFRIRRFLAHDNLKDASKLSLDGPSFLTAQLSKRTGSPPKVLGRTLPQRQRPEPLEPAIRSRLHNLPKKYATEHPESLNLDLSLTEGRSTDAIYSLVQSPTLAHDKVLGNEIAHFHPAENSLHVWLTTADTKKIVDAGWRECFPLASLGMVHDGWTFLYAPRSMEEVDVIETIIKAGIWHLTDKLLE